MRATNITNINLDHAVKSLSRPGWQNMALSDVAAELTEQVRDGWVNTIIRADGIVHLDHYDSEQNVYRYRGVESQLRAGWFSAQGMEGLPGYTVIFVWEPDFRPWARIQDKAAEYRLIAERVRAMGYHIALTRLSGREIQLYCTSSEQSAAGFVGKWGIEASPEMATGKLLKRLSVLSVSQGACARYQELLGGVRIMLDDAPAADGGLLISESFAEMLCEGAGVAFDREVTRLQLWLAEPEGMTKGMAIVDWDCDIMLKNGWHSDGYLADLVVPKESFDPNFRVKNGYIYKLVPHSVRRNQPVIKAFDGLLRMPELVKHADYNEVVQVQHEELMKEDNRLVVEATMKSHHWYNGLFVDEDPEQRGIIESLIRRDRAKLYQPEAELLAELAGWSPFVAPEVMTQTTGDAHGKTRARRERWTNKLEQVEVITGLVRSGLVEDRMLPGAYVSALRGYWTYQGFTDLEVKGNHVRVIWKDHDVDGFVMDPGDDMSKNVQYRSDGGDKDDLLDAVMLWDAKQQRHWLWLVRNPTSWGGGWFMLMYDDDVEKAYEAGYRSYKLAKGYEIDDLPQLAEEHGLQVAWNGGN